jgi:hypothetical protein
MEKGRERIWCLSFGCRGGCSAFPAAASRFYEHLLQMMLMSPLFHHFLFISIFVEFGIF